VHENANLRKQLIKAENGLGEAQLVAEREAKKMESFARATESSLSWRLTVPVRRLGQLVRRLRGRSSAQ